MTKKIDDKKISESILKPLPEEFVNPTTRRIIDERVGEALNIKLKLDPLYDLLASEPMLRCE